MLYTRREMGKLTLAGLPAAGLLLTPDTASGSLLAKPNSNWAGVQVGLNVPYNFGNNLMSGDETLERCLQLGISAVELRSQPIELFLGAPLPAGRGGGGRAAAAPAATPAVVPGRAAGEPSAVAPAPTGGAAAGAVPARGGGRAAATPEQEAAQREAAEGLRKWRLSAPMTRLKDFRKKWADAGVAIEIVKFDWISPLPSDDILEYCFQIAKALGARAISTEVPLARMDDTKHLGEVADRHKIWVGYHGHAEVNAAIWERAFSYAKYNGANLDLGHFVAGNNTSPIPFLKQHHDRITHMHVKDRKMNNGPNVPFGEGDTPIKEALRVLRDNKWKTQATIEFEYPVPAGSDRMAEMAKAVQYCKDALLT